LLSERSYNRTSVDFAVEGSKAVVLVEAKHAEREIGVCGCAGRTVGDCSAKVRKRPYWKPAREHFAFDGPAPAGEDGKPCLLSWSYQAVRNVAAAKLLAGPEREAHWVLLYNEDNPAFAGHQAEGKERWPGWAALCAGTPPAWQSANPSSSSPHDHD
jgi:hypothetical protein